MKIGDCGCSRCNKLIESGWSKDIEISVAYYTPPDGTIGPIGPMPVVFAGKIPKVTPVCKTCNSMNEYTEPNQKDGSYVCFNCR